MYMFRMQYRLCRSMCTRHDIMPSVLLTGILVIGVVSAVIDCEVECVDIGAGRVWLRMVEGICSG